MRYQKSLPVLPSSFPPIPKISRFDLQGEQVYNTLKQQEEMRISGKSARQMVMQVN